MVKLQPMLKFVFYHETASGDCPTYSVHKTETLKQAVRLFCEGQGKYINGVVIGTVEPTSGVYHKFGRLEVRWPGPTLWVVPPQVPPSSFAYWTWCKEEALLWQLRHTHVFGGRGESNVAYAFQQAEQRDAR
jgi:hypothetical protein